MKFLFKILFLIICFSIFLNTFSEYEEALKAYERKEYNKSLKLTYYDIDNNSSYSCEGYNLLSNNYLKLKNKKSYELYKDIYFTCINIPKKAPSYLLKGLSKYNLKQDTVAFLFYMKLLNYDAQVNNKKYNELITKEISFLLSNKEKFIKNSYNYYYTILALYYYKNNNIELFNKNYEKIKNKNFYFLPALKFYFFKINGNKNIIDLLSLVNNYKNIKLISNGKIIFNLYGKIYKLISKNYYFNGDVNNAIKYYLKYVNYSDKHLYDNFLISIFRKYGIEEYKEIVEPYNKDYYKFIYDYLNMRIYFNNKNYEKSKINFRKVEFLISYYKNNIGKVKTNNPLLINGLFEGLISYTYYKNIDNKNYFNTKEKKFIKDNEIFFKSFLVNESEIKKSSIINTNVVKDNSLNKNYKYIIFLLIIFIIILGFFIKNKKNV